MVQVNHKILFIGLILIFTAGSTVVAQSEEGANPDAPVEDEEEELEENESEKDEVNVTVNKTDARETALNALSDLNWTLEESDLDDGVYEFEFASGENEAEVEISGVTGEVLNVDEELEQEEEEDENGSEDEVRSLEEARERIEELENTVDDLREEINELRTNSSTDRPELPDEASDRAREARDSDEGENEENESEGGDIEADIEVEGNETEVEVESEGPPGNSNRPGFVNNLLNSIFG